MKLNLTDAGKRLGMSRTTVAKRIAEGRIAAEIDTDTGYHVIDEAVIEKYNRERYVPYVPPQGSQEVQHTQPSHAGYQ